MGTSTATTRLAPSPTGALHLGNARTFLVNWALAKQQNWRVLLRIDDLDSPRVKPGADQMAIEDLQWLGLTWEGEPAYESQNALQYRSALEHLASAGWIYPCNCTRSQISAAAMSAPHVDAHELRYPGTCRPRHQVEMQFSPTQVAAWRVRAPTESTEFVDQFAGPQSWKIDELVGDFLVTNKSGQAAYQLAVVIDDNLQGVTDVVRGGDLLGSTPRQIWLHRLLGIQPPKYWHLPIVIGEDGDRLAKRHGAFRLSEYRSRGVSVERLIGLIAFWSGASRREPLELSRFVSRFELDRLPRVPAVFTMEDHQWLLKG